MPPRTLPIRVAPVPGGPGVVVGCNCAKARNSLGPSTRSARADASRPARSRSREPHGLPSHPRSRSNRPCHWDLASCGRSLDARSLRRASDHRRSIHRTGAVDLEVRAIEILPAVSSRLERPLAIIVATSVDLHLPGTQLPARRCVPRMRNVSACDAVVAAGARDSGPLSMFKEY